jgi:low affinity Fe/Cu permease
MRPTKSQAWFTHLAKATARVTGRPATFLLAMAVILAWIVTGPVFKFSDTQQLIINTGTTIVTFLTVFLMQSTQNRDSEAVQVKPGELLRVTGGGHNALLDMEELEVYELDRARSGRQRPAERARAELREGRADTDAPEVGQQRARLLPSARRCCIWSGEWEVVVGSSVAAHASNRRPRWDGAEIGLRGRSLRCPRSPLAALKRPEDLPRSTCRPHPVLTVSRRQSGPGGTRGANPEPGHSGTGGAAASSGASRGRGSPGATTPAMSSTKAPLPGIS